MKILDRYIGTAVASSALIVMLILLSLFTFSSFLRELDDVGTGRYGMLEALYYVLLTLPEMAYQLFPVVALLGSVIGLGLLAGHGELTVIRAAGVSIMQIVVSVMKVGLLLVIAATVIGEWLAPLCRQQALSMRTAALERDFNLISINSFWARDGQFFINIRNFSPNGDLGGITIYAFNASQLASITYAKSASYRDGGWQLKEVKRSEISSAGVQVSFEQQLPWATLLDPDMLDVVAITSESLSIVGLLKYIEYLQDNGLDAGVQRAALWKKIVAPVTTAVMVFLAVPFVFGSLRSVSMGQRVLVGTLVGVGFHLLNQIVGYAGIVYEFNPIAVAIVPTAIFLLAALMMTRRIL
ncbi:MAG: LPS export ABC transporter permease LptG [Gammaproteobacteria bacterium]|nr:LPS export ABC transporter permease LptG [Gammaproteobacteria bacterium]